VTKAYKINKNIKFEVFIHKVDGLTEDTKMETQREIHQRANDDLVDSGSFKNVNYDLIVKVRSHNNEMFF